MSDPEIWNKFKYMYSLKKFHNYTFTLGRIGEEFKKEYIERISREFRRARDKGELSAEVFGPSEWEKLQFLIRDPEAYYVKNYLQTSQNQSLTKRVKELETSTTFRVGKAVMFIPISIKKCLKKVLK